MSTPVVLINPPVVRPCEPPGGVALLAGALGQCGIPCRVVDMNREGILYLLEAAPLRTGGVDTWTRRTLKHREANLSVLKSCTGYRNIDRYRRAVADLNHIMEYVSASWGVAAGLTNYQDRRLSPLKSSDLLAAAEHPEENPFYACFRQHLDRTVTEASPAVVGISMNYLTQALCTFAMVGFIKKNFPSLRVILGGGLVTSWMQRPDWRNPFGGLIDDMIAGPGEIPLLQSLGVPTHFSERRPDYSGLAGDGYLSPGPVLPFSTAAGCYWRRCTFCPEKAEGNRFRPLPARNAVDTLRRCAEEMQPSLIHFLDNALPPAFLSTLVKDSPGIPWYGFARVTAQLADPDFCLALKASGCIMLKLGLESGDQSVLDHLEKGIHLETAAAALAALKAAGIGTYVYLLFGTPVETGDKAARTLDFTVRNSASIDFLNLAVFNLPAFGADAEALDTDSFYEGNLSLYRDFRHPAGWDRLAVRRFLDREFRRHPAIASILKRDPPFFTSSHAPFFLLHGALKG